MANPSDINRSCSTVPFILSTRKWDETTRVTHAFPLTRLSIRGRASLFRFLINCRSDAEGYKRIDLFVLRDDNLIRFMKGLVVTCKHIDRLDLREFTREISIILLRCIGNTTQNWNFELYASI